MARVVAPQGAGAQDCWSTGHRTSEVVSIVLRINSELLRQARKGMWGETDHKWTGIVRSGGDHWGWLLVSQGLESRS